MAAELPSQMLQVSIHASAREARLRQASRSGLNELFQSTPPRGRRVRQGGLSAITDVFQSTPPRGRRAVERTHGGAITQCFNPRLRAGGEHRPLQLPVRRNRFQSTPPRGRRAVPAATTAKLARFQSTPPRGRRARLIGADTRMKIVSIHASAREASDSGRPQLSQDLPFQSTPPRGRRAIQVILQFSGQGFQSTPPRGRRGVRSLESVCNHLFQSTPPRGRRAVNTKLLQAQYPFQSTPPRGRRVPVVALNELLGGFNPRLRAGGELEQLRQELADTRFQSTPPRGRRVWPRVGLRRYPGVSIHASAREARSAACS